MRKLIFSFILSLLLGASAYSQIPTDGLVLYLPFDYDANDYSGNGNNGVTYEVYYLHSDRGVTAYFAPHSYIEIKDTASLDFSTATGLTIAVWIRQENDIDGYIIEKMGTGNRFDDEYKMAISWDGTINCGIVSPASFQLFDSNGKLLLNEWYLIVMRWRQEDGILTIYFNGELNSLAYSNITSIQNSAVPLRIGQFIDGIENSFRGSLDDLRIYNRPLSDEEIKAIYTTKVITASGDIAGQTTIELYPNPVQSELHIELPEFSGCAGFKISDVAGRTVLQGILGSEDATIDVNSLKPGFYSILIKNGDKTAIRKIIKK